MFIAAQKTCYYGIDSRIAVHNKFITFLVTAGYCLIGHIYARACGTCANTKPTDL